MMIQIAITNDKGQGLEWITAKIPEGTSLIEMKRNGHLTMSEEGLESFWAPIFNRLAELLGKYDKTWVDRQHVERVSTMVS